MAGRERSILILCQGHAGDRLAARLVPALRRRFPDRELLAAGGPRVEAVGARLLARTDLVSAMGYSGLLPALPGALRAALRVARRFRRQAPACVLAIDIWQPLQTLHRWAPPLRRCPNVCYMPPAPNFIGPARVHQEVAAVFAAVLTPFRHQRRLLADAGARVLPAAHAGLEICLEEATPVPYGEREPILAVLPGSRRDEIAHGLPAQAEAARLLCRLMPGWRAVVGCAGEEASGLAARICPDLERAGNARRLLARSRGTLVCSGTAVLEAAVLGCPGVATYHGSSLQRLEWRKLQAPRLARLREAGIASPFITLPNIVTARELYPELLGAPPDTIADAALEVLRRCPERRAAEVSGVRDGFYWEPAASAVAEAVITALEQS